MCESAYVMERATRPPTPRPAFAGVPAQRRSHITIQVIVTPGSGDGIALSLAKRVRQVLRGEGYVAHLQAFRELGHLIRWTRTPDGPFSHLVAVGGDATLSAAAEAAVRLAVPLVPVPSGFGNLFASAFEYSREPEAVVDLLGRGELLRVDVGVAKSGVFLSHRSYGLLARIQQEVERARRRPRQRHLRALAYYRTAARRLAESSLDSIQVEVDGHLVTGEAAVVTVANVETYRGFLSLTPAASPVDGLLDVCVIPRTTGTRLLTQLIRLLLEIPGCWEGVGFYRGRRVRVSVNGRKPEEVRVLGGGLPALVPAGSLGCLEARQAAAEAKVPVLTLAHTPPALTPGEAACPHERALRLSASGRSRACRARSRSPVGSAAGG